MPLNVLRCGKVRIGDGGALFRNTSENDLQEDDNPLEESDNIASIEAEGDTEDDFVSSDHDLDRLFDDVVDDMNFLTGLLSRIYRLFYADQLANEPDTRKDDKTPAASETLKEASE